MSAVKHNMSLSMILSPPSLQDQEPDLQQVIKRRTACEECRTKKLKCSGTQPACTRCVREEITCFYSPQKTMGRPKKRTRSVEHPILEEYPSRRRSETNSHIHAQHAELPEPQQEQPKRPKQDVAVAYSMGSYAPAFTQDGSLRPWLQHSFPEETAASWNSPLHNAVPALTPDNDSLASPGASIPAADTLFSGSFQLNPTLPHQPCKPLTTASCACLSTLYLTLSTLNNMQTTTDFKFPVALHPLREAMFSAEAVLACEECPKSFNTGLQNTTMLGTLFLSIVECFAKVLEQIDAEAARAEKEGERKRFRLTDLNGENGMHLHLGGPGCAAAFSLDMSPAEWRAMCKKVVRAEVTGPANGADESSANEEHSHCVYFLGLVKQMEERQNRWHKMPLPEDSPKNANSILRPEIGPARENKQYHCLKLVGTSKTLAGNLDWSL